MTDRLARQGRRGALAIVAALALILSGGGLALILPGGGLAPAAAQSEPVLVFAAASLKNALDEAVAAFKQKTGSEVTASYAASSALAKQIEAGAPAAMFMSADLAWMDYLAERRLIAADTRRNLLGNQIVLVATKDSKIGEVPLAPGVDVAGLLEGGRLAMADVAAVPAGKYGKAALEKLGAWSAVADKLAQAENVRAALALVSRGEAPLGVVYRTDVAADPNVRIVGTFPEDSHPPIIYPVALTTAAEGPAAADFLAFLRGSEARAAFTKQGFTVLDAPAS